MLDKTKRILACAIALAGLGACTNNDQAPNNPNYNSDKDEVTAQFVFNV